MGEHVLQDRERALENAFFARQEQALLEKLREGERSKSRKEAIAAASGIQDDAVLDKITALGLGPETVAALALVPLALVAWADGSLDARERAAVMEAARDAGVTANGEAARLLDTWLAAPPGADLKAAWRGYAAALAAGLDESRGDGRPCPARGGSRRRRARPRPPCLGGGGERAEGTGRRLHGLTRARTSSASPASVSTPPTMSLTYSRSPSRAQPNTAASGGASSCSAEAVEAGTRRSITKYSA